MQFVLLCEDKPDSLDLRLATREAHLAFVRERAASVALAGPLLSDDGERMLGSLFLIDAASIDDVRALHADDPYTRAGLWGNVIIRAFRPVVPAR